MRETAKKLPEFDRAAAPLSEDLRTDPEIARIMATMRSHFGLGTALVSRYVEDDLREVTHIDSTRELSFGTGYREPRENSYCFHILEGRLPELIRDPQDHAFTSELGVTRSFPVGCYLGSALTLADGTVWGSVCVVGEAPDPSLNDRDHKLLQSFAGMISARLDAAYARHNDNAAMRERVEGMLDGHAVSIFQQPIHALENLSPVGVECLARFPDIKKRGPDAWFEDSERVGLATELEMTAITCALDTVAGMPEGIFAAINVSPRTVLTGALRRALEEAGPANLVIEIGQHEAVEDITALAREIDALRPHAKIAIDDVEAGYNGLAHIVELKPDILKMDMLLTRHIETDPARRAITAAMVSFAKQCGAQIVAEGIESEAECAVMRELGVDYGQGYLFARPLPVVAARQHLLGSYED